MTKQIIVDKNDNPIGLKERADILPEDVYRVCSLWLINSRNEILIAQRAFSKKKDPGLWGPAIAGTLDEGEIYESQMKKEIREELGIADIDLIIGSKRFHDGKTQLFVQKFYAEKDIDLKDMRLEKEEVENVRWIGQEELEKEIVDNPEKYILSMPYYMKNILRDLKIATGNGRICLFGDSVTWGQYLPINESWAGMLAERKEESKTEVINLALDGDTSTALLTRLEKQLEEYHPETVVVAIGVNDTLRINGIIETPKDIFESNLKEIIKKVGEKRRLIFVGLVKGDDSLTNPLAISSRGKCYNKAEIKEFDQIIEKVAIENDKAYIKLYDKLTDSDFLDGLHPDKVGHRKMYNEIIKYL